MARLKARGVSTARIPSKGACYLVRLGSVPWWAVT